MTSHTPKLATRETRKSHRNYSNRNPSAALTAFSTSSLVNASTGPQTFLFLVAVLSDFLYSVTPRSILSICPCFLSPLQLLSHPLLLLLQCVLYPSSALLWLSQSCICYLHRLLKTNQCELTLHPSRHCSSRHRMASCHHEREEASGKRPETSVAQQKGSKTDNTCTGKSS